MQVNVSQLLKEPIGAVRNYSIDEGVRVTDTGDEAVIQGDVKFTRTNRGVLVQGILKTSLPVECSRCLETYEFKTIVKLEEEFFPVIDVLSGAPVPVPEEPGYFTIDEHHILDLNEAIRQNILLSIPMKPLCREDCAGLCVKCGNNLNEGECDCSTQETDPRWAKLAVLAAEAKKVKRRKGNK